MNMLQFLKSLTVISEVNERRSPIMVDSDKTKTIHNTSIDVVRFNMEQEPINLREQQP